MPKRRAASAMGASPTSANQPMTASRRRSRRLVSAPGALRGAGAASSPSWRDAGAGAPGSAGGGAATVRALSQETSSSWKAGGPNTMAWSRSPNTQERMEANEDTPSARSTDPSSRRPTTLSRPTSSATRRRLERIDPDAHLDPVLAGGLPGLVGQCRLDVDALGDIGATVLAPRDLSFDAVDAERAHGRAVDVPGDQVPVAEAEPQPDRGHSSDVGPVGEFRRGARADGLEELDQRAATGAWTRWAGRRPGPPRPASAAHPGH